MSGVEVGVAPPFVYLDAVHEALAGSKVLLGAQDCYCEKNGAFTGEVSIEMLKDVGVTFCLAGQWMNRARDQHTCVRIQLAASTRLLTTASAAELEKLEPDFRRRGWRLVRCARAFPGAARNAAAAMARGR